LFSRDKAEWTSTANNLRSTIAALQQREADALRQVQQSVEVAEQAQEERALVCLLFNFFLSFPLSFHLPFNMILLFLYRK